MFNIFGDVIKRFYISQQKVISIDNYVAKLHYRITFWLLLACCALVCSRQYFGEHIRCLVDSYNLPAHVINTYCFFTSTYTLHNGSEPTLSARHAGVSPHSAGQKIVHHTYYQWVPFILFGQALLFHLPHFVWKHHERGTIRGMAFGLQRLYLHSSKDGGRLINGHTIFSYKQLSEIATKLRTQIVIRSCFKLNRHWCSKLIHSELMALFNVLLQVYAIDSFLGGNFMDLGVRILSNNARDNPFERVFPKMAKCDFHKYGPSGSIQKYDALCVMALNIINEKIYAILWFWFILLIPITCASLFWRVITIVLHSRSSRFNYHLMHWSAGVKLNEAHLAAIKRFRYSDWLFVYYLSSNLDSVIVREMLNHLGKEIDERMPSTSSSDLEEEKKSLGALGAKNDNDGEQRPKTTHGQNEQAMELQELPVTVA